jgi:hypothetical protein
MTYTMAHPLQESGDDAAASRSLSMEARRVAAMCAAMEIVSLRSPGCEMGSGDHLREILTRSKAMAKPKKSRAQQTVQEHPLVTTLLAELQAIDDRRQCAVRFHTLMNQRCPLEIPVQYERLFLHSPAGKEEKKDDYRRGTQQSHRRRIPHQRV